MNQVKQLYKNIYDLVIETKEIFKSRGYIIPLKQKNGSVKIGNYTIQRNDNGQYDVINSFQQKAIERINLPQTAIMVANDLATGKWPDSELILKDRQYGFNTFEEKQLEKVMDYATEHGQWDRVDSLMIKKHIATLKAESAKNFILTCYSKLRRFG